MHVRRTVAFSLPTKQDLRTAADTRPATRHAVPPIRLTDGSPLPPRPLPQRTKGTAGGPSPAAATP